MGETRRAIMMSPDDNIAVAIVDLAAGEDVTVQAGGNSLTVRLRDAVGFGHKFALRDMASGDKVLKYATVIGLATGAIEQGRHVHIHNVESIRARGDIKK